MSVRLMAVVFDRADLSANEKLLLLYLADRANDDGDDCYPGIERMVRATGMSRRTVQRTRGELEARGLLETVSRTTRKGQTRRYRLHLSTGARLAPVAPSRVPESTGTGANVARNGRQAGTLTVLEPSLTATSSPSPASTRPVDTGDTAASTAEAEAVVEAIRNRIPDAPAWLAGHAAGALERGWTPAAIASAVTADPLDAVRSVAAVLARRIDDLARLAPPAPARPRPAWCGSCDETTRLRWVNDETLDGGLYRCPDCHPEPEERSA